MPDKIKKREFDEVSKEKNSGWQHLVEHCLDLYDQFKKSDYREKQITEIKKSRRVYEQEREDTNDPWPGASNIELPLCTISVDNLEPRFFAGLVGKKPYVQFVVEGGSQPDEETELLENWWNDELEHGIGIENITRIQVHDLLLEGTIYPMVSYDIEEIERRDFEFGDDGNIVVDETGNYSTVDVVEPVFEGGRVRPVPFTDVFIPDDAEDWEQTPVIRKVDETYAKLKRKSESEDGYCNIGSWLIKEEGSGKLSDDQQSPVQDISDIKVTGKETIECIECSLRYIYQEEDEEKKDIENWHEERIIVQIALDKQILVRILKLRDLNFRNEHLIKRIRLFPEYGRAYGTSIYGKMKSIQDGASRTFNTVINVADVTMMPWFFFESSTGLKGDIELHPGKGVEVDSTQGLEFPKFNINPTQFIEFIHLWTSMWERLLSIGDLQVGRPKENKKTTATEVMAVIQEGNVKHNYQNEMVKTEFMSVIRTLYDLYYKNMPADKVFKHNEEEVPIPRQSMGRKRKFRLSGSTEQNNKLIERKENEDLYTLVLNDPAGIFNPIPIREDLLKSYGKDNPEKYINPFLFQLSLMLKEMPQLQEGIESFIQDTMQAAKELEGGDV